MMDASSSRGFKARDVAVSLLMKLVKAMVSIHPWTEHSPLME